MKKVTPSTDAVNNVTVQDSTLWTRRSEDSELGIVYSPFGFVSVVIWHGSFTATQLEFICNGKRYYRAWNWKAFKHNTATHLAKEFAREVVDTAPSMIGITLLP